MPISWPKLRLHPPDRRQHVAADADIAPPRGRARAPSLAIAALPSATRSSSDEPVDIVPDRRLELGLLLLEIEHFHVGLEPVEGDVEGAGGNPAARGLGS